MIAATLVFLVGCTASPSGPAADPYTAQEHEVIADCRILHKYDCMMETEYCTSTIYTADHELYAAPRPSESFDSLRVGDVLPICLEHLLPGLESKWSEENDHAR